MQSSLLSLLVHGVFLFLLIYRLPVHAKLLKPSDLLQGSRGTSTELLYLSRQGQQEHVTPHPDHSRKPTSLQAPRFNAKQIKPEIPSATDPAKAANDLARNDPMRAGSPLGSLSNGPTVGYVVQPALPIVGPDVPRSSIPAGVEGSVIVEVTIDTQGNVTATRVLQSLGAEVDDKVVATLHTWRFRPATTDGVASISKQDVYFHFPS
jgi:periplasmic protein TonB